MDQIEIKQSRACRLVGERNILIKQLEKIKGLTDNGIEIVRRALIDMPANPYNVSYLETKKAKAGHLLE